MILTKTQQRLLGILQSLRTEVTARALKREYDRRFKPRFWFGLTLRAMYHEMQGLQDSELVACFIEFDGTEPVKHFRATPATP